MAVLSSIVVFTFAVFHAQDAAADSGAPLQAQPNPSPDTPAQVAEEIVITAKRRRGEVVTPHRPLLRLNQKTIRALGAPSLDKLLERVRTVARGAGGTEPVLLLNGLRIAGEEEIASLPPEAIEQMDVLPESVAAQFCYPATSRVVNIITARRFTSLQLDTSVATPAGGRGADVKLAGAGTLLRGDLRSLVAVSRRRRMGITVHDDGFIDTLLPAEQELKVNGSLAGPLAREVNASLAVNVEQSSQTRRASVVGPLPSAMTPVNIRSRAAAVRMTGILQGFWGDWAWTSTLSVERARSSQDSGPVLLPSRGSSARTGIAMQVAGPVATLPGGSARATTSVEVSAEAAASTSPLGPGDARLQRRAGIARIDLSIPLTRPDDRAVTLNAAAEVTLVSAYGSLASWSASLTANPFPGVQLSINHSDRATAPTMAQTGAPTLVYPGTPFFDRVTGRDVLIDRISGGNPDLRAEQRRTLDLGVEFQPFKERELRLAATYSVAWARRNLASIDVIDPALEAAFPMLYRRDAAGNLLSVTSMPVNLQSRRQSSLRWTLAYSGDLKGYGGNAEMPRTPLFVLANIDGEVRIRDVVQLAPGLPPLNLLDGGALEDGGGRPAFELNGFVGLSTANLGFDIGGRWRTVSRLRSTDPASDLTLSGLLTFRLGTFLNLEALSGAAWSRTLRLELSADNIFNARQHVRDREGNTPFSLSPGRLDPQGRTVTVSLRKLF